MACKEDANGALCDENVDASSALCSPWQLTKSDEKEICYMSGLVEEHLNIGGADINLFKLLGVHEQGQLIDLTGNGSGISSGDGTNFPITNAFDIYQTEWRSTLKGQNLLDSGYIGYDFGEIKLDNGRLQYGVETYVKHNIATIRIKQSNNSENRVTKARIERSNDGIKWFGAAIVKLPDDGFLNTINFNHTVPSRYWRIRPLEFNGNGTNYWAVQALELIDYDTTTIDDIQDEIFQENRDRDYSFEAIAMKAQYDLLDVQSELTAFGIELPSQTYYLQFAFSACVRLLGRPVVIGDILEMPSEAQYSFNLKRIKKYVEVTDVAWAVDGFTPGYTPTLLRIMAQPMIASQETMDLFDEIADEPSDDNGLSKYGLKDLNVTEERDGPEFQDNEDVAQYIAAAANTHTPELGVDTADINIFTDQQIQNAADQGVENLSLLNVNQKALYIEDALPPNGIDYTIGDVLPDITPSLLDGAYHRLTYSGINKDIPARLFKFSIKKNRWIFMESDKRAENNPIKPRLQEYYKDYNNPVDNKDI